MKSISLGGNPCHFWGVIDLCGQAGGYLWLSAKGVIPKLVVNLAVGIWDPDLMVYEIIPT